MPLFLLPFLAGAKSFFSALIKFCSKPPGSWIAAALGLLLALWWFGQHEFNKGKASIIARNEKAAVKIETVQRQITFDVGMKFAAVQLADTKATGKRLSEVSIHVSPKADSECPVTLGFVRVWNDAAHGPIPDASTGPDDAPSGVALSDVAKATVENDGQYDLIADQLKALQEWVKEQQRANP